MMHTHAESLMNREDVREVVQNHDLQGLQMIIREWVTGLIEALPDKGFNLLADIIEDTMMGEPVFALVDKLSRLDKDKHIE